MEADKLFQAASHMAIQFDKKKIDLTNFTKIKN